MKRSVALTSAVAALAARASVVRAQGEPAQVVLASTANDDVTPALYAQEQGWFHEARLDVSFQVSNNGSAIAAAVSGGSAQIGRSNVVPLFTARAHGIPIVLVAPSGVSIVGAPTGGLLVLKDSRIRAARDLSGQVISVAGIADIMAIGTRNWIDKNGADSSQVQFVEISGEQAGVALDAGRVAAATLVNPFLSEMLATGRYRLLADPVGSLAPRVLEAAWFATVDYATRNVAVIRSFSSIIARASAFCNDHPDQTVDVLSRFSHVDAATIAHSVRDKYDLRLTPGDIQPLVDAAARYKVIAQTFDVRDFIDPNALT